MTLDEIAQIDHQLQQWRQGDIVMSPDVPTLHLAHMAAPGTDASELLAAQLAQEGEDPSLVVVTTDTPGFMIVSQTCDLVRSCLDRPFVEICPLQMVAPAKLPMIRNGRQPRYVWCTGIGEADLAVDLEQVATIEKAALVRLAAERREGTASAAEARALSEALGRKRSRAALPNDFTALMEPLQRRVIERYSKDTPEGRFLRAIREIRVRARPGWEADQPEIELLFLFDGDQALPQDSDDRASELLGRLVPGGRYAVVEGRALSLHALSAAEYLESDRLDLEHLSAPKPPK